MLHSWTIGLIAGLCCSASAFADTPMRFRWQTGQVLNYQVQQTTTATETAPDDKNERLTTTTTTTKLTCVKRWQVLSVDAEGIATLQLSLTSLKVETTKPNGETVTLDSSKLDPNHPDQKEMASFLSQPVAVLRVNALGQVVEVKESKFGPASRFQADLPFKLVLPEMAVAQGKQWEREYDIKLEPPQGTGETFPAKQVYAHKGETNQLILIGLTSTLKNPVEGSELIPLLPFLMEGELYFHAETGRYYAARLKSVREIVQHQGEGTKYVFQTVYVEDAINK